MAFVKDRVVKQPLGRPSLYRPEYAEQLIEFFETAEIPEKDADGRIVREGFFPTLARFATYCGVTQITLRNWANAKDIDDVTPLHPEFFTAYSKAREYQEASMSEGYMSGRWQNPGFGALIAKNLLAWKDKQEVESTVTQTTDMTVNVTSSLADTLAKVKAKTSKE